MIFNFNKIIFNPIDLNIFKLFFLALPEITLGVCILLVIIANITFKFKKVEKIQQETTLIKKYLVLILIIATAYYLVLLKYLTEESFIIYSHMFLISYYILIIKSIVTFISAIILWLSLLFLKNIKTKNTLEFPIAFMCLILNTLVFISSFNLLSMYITFEILAITLYILSVSGYRCKISLVGYFYRKVYKSFWSMIRKEWRKGKGRR